MESASCSVVAELDQYDMVVSIRDDRGSLFGAKRLFSKGDARISVGRMAVALEEAASCHVRTGDEDDAVVGDGDMGAVIVDIVELDEIACGLYARGLPVLREGL